MANTTIAKAIASGITNPRCSNGGVGGGKLEKERLAGTQCLINVL